MKTKKSISLSDFNFKMVGYGQWNVTYFSPITGKQWTRYTTNAPLIDETKNSDNPKVCDLNRLKKLCKS